MFCSCTARSPTPKILLILLMAHNHVERQHRILARIQVSCNLVARAEKKQLFVQPFVDKDKFGAWSLSNGVGDLDGCGDYISCSGRFARSTVLIRV